MISIQHWISPDFVQHPLEAFKHAEGAELLSLSFHKNGKWLAGWSCRLSLLVFTALPQHGERFVIIAAKGSFAHRMKSRLNSTAQAWVRKRKPSQEGWEWSPHYTGICWTPGPETLRRSCFPEFILMSLTAGTGVKSPPCATQLLSLRPVLFYQWVSLHMEWKQKMFSGQVLVPWSAESWNASVLPLPFLVPFHSWTALVLLPQVKRQPAFSLPAARETWDFSQQHFVHTAPKQTWAASQHIVCFVYSLMVYHYVHAGSRPQDTVQDPGCPPNSLTLEKIKIQNTSCAHLVILA